MAKRILIIEDDTDINNLIAEALTKAGYECVQAFSGTEGLTAIRSDSFSLVILDLMLPGMDGASVLARIRETQSVPVIVVSARDGLDDKVRLLTAGAEDYLTKPFEVLELVTRVNVQLRRLPDEKPEKHILRYRDLVLNTENFTATLSGHPASLTRQEFKILELMLQNPPGRVFSKHDFYTYAWGSDYMGEDKTINVHISNIRKKLKALSDEEYIETVWGIGFRLVK